jgi:hypothetical protein
LTKLAGRTGQFLVVMAVASWVLMCAPQGLADEAAALRAQQTLSSAGAVA